MSLLNQDKIMTPTSDPTPVLAMMANANHSDHFQGGRGCWFQPVIIPRKPTKIVVRDLVPRDKNGRVVINY